jgi:hypothetical protein
MPPVPMGPPGARAAAPRARAMQRAPPSRPGTRACLRGRRTARAAQAGPGSAPGYGRPSLRGAA